MILNAEQKRRIGVKYPMHEMQGLVPNSEELR